MVLASVGDTSLLLGTQDVPPVHEDNVAGRSPFLLTSDHYGRLIPRVLGDLGLPADELGRHIAWDIGIAGVADALSKQLDANLIAQRYSRLVIDCNRPLAAPGSIPRISEATVIPGNEGLTRDAVEARRRQVFDPYHRRIGEVIDRRLREGIPTVLVSLHSFTPVYAGIARPWHVGTLYQSDTRLPPRESRSRGRRQRTLCGERRDRLHHSRARRGARLDEHGNRNPSGLDRGS